VRGKKMRAQRPVIPPALAQLQAIRSRQIDGEHVFHAPVFLYRFPHQGSRKRTRGLKIIGMKFERTENKNHLPTTSVASISISHSGRIALTNTNILPPRSLFQHNKTK